MQPWPMRATVTRLEGRFRRPAAVQGTTAGRARQRLRSGVLAAGDAVACFVFMALLFQLRFAARSQARCPCDGVIVAGWMGKQGREKSKCGLKSGDKFSQQAATRDGLRVDVGNGWARRLPWPAATPVCCVQRRISIACGGAVCIAATAVGLARRNGHCTHAAGGVVLHCYRSVSFSGNVRVTVVGRTGVAFDESVTRRERVGERESGFVDELADAMDSSV